MAKPTGFLEYPRSKWPYRPVAERVRDWRQVMAPWPEDKLQVQAARCMDCGIPFCHSACPLGNRIPDWNDLVYRGHWRAAFDQLQATNNFPEFTGTLCPAPCEGSCVLGIHDDPVHIKAVELTIIEHAFAQGWVVPQPPARRSGKSVGIIGSGPAGLAAAQQLARAGHAVTVYERADRIGGLLRYGIPEFKMEKWLLDRRIEQMRAEGVSFQTRCHVGVDVHVSQLRQQHDALLLAGGACQARDLNVPGRELQGIHLAMAYLTQQNRRCHGDFIPEAEAIDAKGKRVVIIGGGDTGADCLGTAHRQGAASVHMLEIMPRPPDRRAPDNPWPEWPLIYRVASAHEEGGERLFSVSSKRFLGDAQGHVRAVELVKVERVQHNGRWEFREIPGSTFTLPCDLVLLSLGFTGPEKSGLLEQLGVKLNARGNVERDAQWMTNVPGVFTAGDMQRGQSLIVWALAEGRSAAAAIDRWLMGQTFLPAPLP